MMAKSFATQFFENLMLPHHLPIKSQYLLVFPPFSHHFPTIFPPFSHHLRNRNTEAVGGVRYLHQHRDEGSEVGPAAELRDHPALEIRGHAHVGVPARARIWIWGM